MKIRLLLVCLSCVTVFFACSTENHKGDTSPSRQTASVSSDVNPATGKTFWEEYDNAQAYVAKTLALPLIGNVDIKKVGYLKGDDFSKMAITLAWVRSNPLALFKALHEKKPTLVLHALPIEQPIDGENNGTVLVTKFEDVKEVLDNYLVFTVRNYHNKISNSVGPFMLATDGSPKYNTFEKPWMRKMLAPSDLPRVRQMIRDLAQKAIHDNSYVAQRLDKSYYGRIELVNNLARRVPIWLTRKYFGITGTDDYTLQKWSRAIQFDLFHNVKNEAAIRSESLTAGHEMQAYLQKLLAERRQAHPVESDDETVMDRLIRTVDSKELQNFTDDRIGTNIIGTLIGNVETTEAAVVQSLEELFKRPAVLKLAVKAAHDNDMDTLSKYVWEALRFQPVNPFVVRYAERDFTIAKGTPRETLIKKGDLVLAGTHGAMLDSDNFVEPEKFRIDRPGTPLYFHLGYGHHRCLGDYISEVQVPELVRAVLLLEDVKPASGYQGQVNKNGGLHGEEQAFPESFVVEYKASHAPTANQVQLVDPNLAFEDYLMDFDRNDFRQCLSNSATFGGEYEDMLSHRNLDYKRALLFCRFNKGFQACMKTKAGPRSIANFDLFAVNSPKREAAFAQCDQKSPLTQTEKTFYRQIFLNQPISSEEFSRISTSQAQRGNHGWGYEDVLKFYNRYTFRECLLNPKGRDSFPQAEQMLFYARLPIEFRMCMGVPVLLHQATREEQFPKCADGVYNAATGRYEGGLSDTEKYYYRTLILGQNQ